MDMINNVLTAVGSDYDYRTLAQDIASYERNLARVSANVAVTQCFIVISLLMKESLTDTELRNVAALYNPMTLQELQNLFNMVGDLYYSFTKVI